MHSQAIYCRHLFYVYAVCECLHLLCLTCDFSLNFFQVLSAWDPQRPEVRDLSSMWLGNTPEKLQHVTLQSLRTLTMLSLWNLYVLLLVSLPLSLYVVALTGENTQETQQLDTDTAVQHLTHSSQRPHGSGLESVNPMFGPENVDFLSLPLSWSSSLSEESDRQGVIGEYTDLQESTETSLLYSNEKALVLSSPTESATEDIVSKRRTQSLRSPLGVSFKPTQEKILKYQPAEASTRSVLHSTQTGENQPFFSASQDETTESPLPFLLSGSLPSNRPDQDSTSPFSVGSWPSPEHTTPPATGRWEWTTSPLVTTQKKTQEGTVPLIETGDGAVTMEAEKGIYPCLIWNIYLTTITNKHLSLKVNVNNAFIKSPCDCSVCDTVCIQLADAVVLHSQNALHHSTSKIS